MARTYTNSLAAVTATYPGVVYEPLERLNFAPDYPERIEPFTVPAVPDSDGRYRIELDYAINSLVTPVIDCGALNDMARVPYGVPVSAGQVGVSVREIPILEFNAARAGETGSITYQPLGSVRTADWENRIQVELEATQEAVSGGSVLSVNGASGTVVLEVEDIVGSLGTAGQVLATNGTADGVEWVDQEGGGDGGAVDWGDIGGTLAAQTDLQTALDAKASASSLTTHTANTSNPHSVTKAQVGLSDVDNTSDASKPISTATQTALDAKLDTTVTTKGDLIVRGASAPTRLPVGANGYYLTADSAEATGLKWVPSSGGGVADPTGTGVVVKTGSGTAVARTIMGTSNDITVTNGSGVSGNPTLATGSNIPKLNTSNTFTALQTVQWEPSTTDHFEVKATGTNKSGSIGIYNSVSDRVIFQNTGASSIANAGDGLFATLKGGSTFRIVANGDTALTAQSMHVDANGVGINKRLRVGYLTTPTPPTSGAYVQTPSLNVGAGTTVNQILSATTVEDLSSIAAGASSVVFLTVTGAASGDTVIVTPSTDLGAGLVWTAWVSAANTVTWRVTNVTGSSIDPASATVRVTVIKF